VLGAGKAPYTGYPAQLHLDDNDMYVHSGWQDAWSSMRTDVFHLVPDAASAGQDGWSLFIVGHSLGGALAQYCFVDSLTKQLLTELRCSKITCRTFGAPLIGNAKFWLALDALMEALFDHSALIVDVAFYEAEHEVFGTFNQRYVSLFTLSKLLGYDASPYAKPLPITTADWAIDARVHRVQLTHHIATYITYFSTISNTPPRPIRKIEDAKNWVVAFLVIDGGDPAAGQADFVAMLYPVQGTLGRSSLFNAALQVPDGASVVIGGSRPADWNVNDLTLRSDPRNPHAVSVGTLVMYLDDLECLRIEDVMFPAGEAGVRSVTLSGFSGGG
jgi:hypothetical protein